MNKCVIVSVALVAILTIFIIVVICTTDIKERPSKLRQSEKESLLTGRQDSLFKQTLNDSEIIPSKWNTRLLPMVPECGNGPVKSGRIVGGNRLEPDEHPWLVLLQYKFEKDDRLDYECGGVIINQRYILTAAHCLVGDPDRDIELVSVLVGEYDLSKENDCVKTGINTTKCPPKPQTFQIEEVIPHPNYNHKKHNDIGLIRVADDIEYSNYVKPICLPVGYELQLNDTMYAAGWGYTAADTQSPSDVKKAVRLPIYDFEACKSKFAKYDSIVVESQMCAGGEANQDSCQNDSGGPLMNQEGNYWYTEGIVSYGRSCGLKDWPGVYTRVRFYDAWIRKTLK